MNCQCCYPYYHNNSGYSLHCPTPAISKQQLLLHVKLWSGEQEGPASLWPALLVPGLDPHLILAPWLKAKEGEGSLEDYTIIPGRYFSKSSLHQHYHPPQSWVPVLHCWNNICPVISVAWHCLCYTHGNNNIRILVTPPCPCPCEACRGSCTRSPWAGWWSPRWWCTPLPCVMCGGWWWRPAVDDLIDVWTLCLSQYYFLPHRNSFQSLWWPSYSPSECVCFLLTPSSCSVRGPAAWCPCTN